MQPGGKRTTRGERISQSNSKASSSDALASLAATWVSDRESAEDLMAQWSRLEQSLVHSVGALDVGATTTAVHDEVQEMAQIDRRLSRLFEKSHADAGLLSALHSDTIEGVLTKLVIIRRLLYPADVDETAWRLLLSANNDLQRISRRRAENDDSLK